MTSKDKKFVENWGKTIKMGRKKYTIIYGLIYGVLTFLFTNLIVYFGFGDKTMFQFPRAIFQLLLFCAIGLFLFYKINWKANNTKYNSLKNK